MAAQDSGRLHIHPDMSAHGTSGFVPVAYPRFFYNQSGALSLPPQQTTGIPTHRHQVNVLSGLQELGVPINDDANAGDGAGAMLIPSSMSPGNQTRADSRRSYLDPVIGRPNLHVAVGLTVTRLLVGRPSTNSSRAGARVPDVWIRGVEVMFRGFVGGATVWLTPVLRQYTRSRDDERRTVLCSREVILAGGAIFSPVLMQLSGIGPATVLESLGIDVVIDLEGVGNNLQDHGMTSVLYNCKRPSSLGSSCDNSRMLTMLADSDPAVFTENNITDANRDSFAAQYSANKTGSYLPPTFLSPHLPIHQPHSTPPTNPPLTRSFHIPHDQHGGVPAAVPAHDVVAVPARRRHSGAVVGRVVLVCHAALGRASLRRGRVRGAA